MLNNIHMISILIWYFHEYRVPLLALIFKLYENQEKPYKFVRSSNTACSIRALPPFPDTVK